MALTPKLELRQSQSLVMTPQLQQAIKLLQMSSLELTSYVDSELEHNPLLEREDDHSTDLDLPDSPVDISNAESERAEPLLDASEGRDESPLDLDIDNTFTNDDDGGRSDAFTDAAEGFSGTDNLGSYGGGSGYDGDGNLLEQTVGEAINLRDHLTRQLGLTNQSPADTMIGTLLIDMLDDAGYLPQDLSFIQDTLGCTAEDVLRVLSIVQGFDPVGIFARSLSECLALQLAEKNRLDPAISVLLDNLELLAKRDYGKLKKLCQVDDEDLADMIKDIRALDPKPASSFDSIHEHPIIPDILMRKDTAGNWVLELNTDTMPRVLVANRYYAEISAHADKQTKSFLNEKFQAANWLVKSLHQRATTIMKVATEIVRQQDGFFNRGISALKPLILKDVADVIGMHESTVSRVTTNKYIASPRGIYELKFFFTQALGSTGGGDAHSAEAVRHRIKSLIEQETAKAVLSDDRIAAILQEDGVDIARRTVAKYREAMKIPSSAQRRRAMKIQLS